MQGTALRALCPCQRLEEARNEAQRRAGLYGPHHGPEKDNGAFLLPQKPAGAKSSKIYRRFGGNVQTEEGMAKTYGAHQGSSA